MSRESTIRRLLQRQRAGQHFDLGERLERAGRLDEAMAEFKSAIAMDPHLVEGQIALGYHYRRKGLLRKAAEAFQAAANLAGDFESYSNLGYVLADLGCYAEAQQAFQRCLQLKPDDPVIRYELAYVLYMAEQYEPALAQVEALLGIYPEDWELLLLQGSCHLGRQEYAQAVASFLQAQKAAPDEEARELAREHGKVALRHQEFGARGPLTTKDRLYADYGAVVLGTATDNGLAIGDYPAYAFDFRAIAVSLRRLVALHDALKLNLSALVPAHTQALPLVAALGELLDLPLVPWEQLSANDVALIVMATCSSPELYDLILERIPAQAITLALAVDWSYRNEFTPDLIGILTQKPATWPWTPGEDWSLWAEDEETLETAFENTPAGRTVWTLAEHILQVWRALPPEPFLAKQLAYYQQHQRLRLWAALQDSP